MTANGTANLSSAAEEQKEEKEQKQRAALAALKDAAVNIPRNLADALEFDDPIAALHLYSKSSLDKANALSDELATQLAALDLPLPEVLQSTTGEDEKGGGGGGDDDYDGRYSSSLSTALACSDSIFHSLQKIASGGSQASQEIRQLEQEKRDLDQHADDIQQALALRKQAQQAQQSVQAQGWHIAAQAVGPYLDWKQSVEKEQGGNGDDDDDDNNEEEKELRAKSLARVREYAGDYALQQLERTHDELQKQVLQLYHQAVQDQNLHALGQLTPVLSLIELESQGLSLYLQFLKTTLQKQLQEQAKQLEQQQQQQQGGSQPQQQQSPFVGMASVYNTAVQCLRHHLPLVSHYLHKPKGDAAVVQLVHVNVEQFALPQLSNYQKQKQIPELSNVAEQIAEALEDRYGTGGGGSRGGGGGLTTAIDGYGSTGSDQIDLNAPDCGFSSALGSLADVDACMEEAALGMQHSESYLRFLQHTCREVNNARRIRHQQEVEAKRIERERHEWTTGRKSSIVAAESESKEYEELQILPPFTQLHQAIAEFGGQYAGMERCLILASMQRAFAMDETEESNAQSATNRMHYRPLSLTTGVAADAALQTAVVDTCLYATRRSTQRVFATGHTGTASAMTNFTVDCLSVLLEVLSQRAEDYGVTRLKPGDGLLVGAAGGIVTSLRFGHHPVVGGPTNPKDEVLRKQQRDENIARACSVLNDIEVAVHHTQQLESLLSDTVQKGFPPEQHDTEQLLLCVKSLGNVTDSFQVASNAAIESLESVLRPRIRSIVGEAVGSESSALASTSAAAAAAGGFMASSVMSGGKAMADRAASTATTSRMNYNLDDETYNLQQLSEGYVARLCTLLDELLNPLRTYLAPRLWDKLLLDVLGTVAKRLESSLRKCEFTSLGALALDSDMRDVLSYAKDRLHSPEYSSNVAITRACVPLARLLQIAKLSNVDELDDVLDLISSSKRKQNWDLKLDDTKAFLGARVEFDAEKVNDLLRLPDED